MIPAHKKKELIAFIELLEDENVLAEMQALLVKATSASPVAPVTPAAPPTDDNDPRTSAE